MTVPRYGAVISSKPIMADEQTAEKDVEENNEADSPTEETNLSEVEETEVESEETQAEQTDKATEEPKAKDKKFTGAEKRIHKLVDERDKAKAEAQDLYSKLAELTGGEVPSSGENTTYMPPDNQSGERELTIDDLRVIARLEAEKLDTVRRINSEAKEAMKLHPELDKDGDSFDPDINDAVTSAVWLEVQKDPSKSVIKLTEKYMKPYKNAADKAIGEEKKTLVKQASEGALKPVSVKSVDKSAEDKSIEELEAELETVY